MNNKITLESFIGTLLKSVEICHIFHLEAKDGKLNTHLALEEFYKSMQDFVDSIYEQTNSMIELNTLQNLIERDKYDNVIDYLTELKTFIIENKSIYDSNANSNILSIIDDVQSLIEQTLYKIINLNESAQNLLKQTTAINKIQTEYLNNELSFNGNLVRDWFENNAKLISDNIERNLKTDYRSVSRNIAGLFYSDISKMWYVVFESYRHGFYAMCKTKMIQIYQAEKVNDIRYFKCDSNEDLERQMKAIDSTLTTVYLNCRDINN